MGIGGSAGFANNMMILKILQYIKMEEPLIIRSVTMNIKENGSQAMNTLIKIMDTAIDMTLEILFMICITGGGILFAFLLGGIP